MIAYALTLAAYGQQVLMVFQTTRQAKEAMRTVELNKTSWATYANINACSAFAAPDIDWQTVTLRGVNTRGHQLYGVALLVDHEVIRQKYEWVLDAYNRFDTPTAVDTYRQRRKILKPHHQTQRVSVG
jgi:hypothetical protein